MYNDKANGELAERLKAPSWKGGEAQASESSNLLFSAICKPTHFRVGFLIFFNVTLDFSATFFRLLQKRQS